MGSSKRDLFTYVRDFTLTIDNGIGEVPAVAFTHSIDASVGDFMTKVNFTGYFNDVDSRQAIRDNTDLGIYLAAGRKNEGFVVDVPLARGSASNPEISAGNPITVAIDAPAGENAAGYTINFDFFDYLPQ